MSNYRAIVAKIERTIPIEKADRIHIGVVLGEYTIVSKEWTAGKIGVFFPAGAQLSVEFCRENNLFRHADLNKDPNKTGFFDDNRRVRCQKFLGVKSEAFFCGLESLAYAGNPLALKVGDAFEEFGGRPICKKYINPRTRTPREGKGKQQPKVSAPFFEEHVETGQFNYNLHKIKKGDLISIQAKGHGTSGRSGIQKVLVKPTGWRKFVNGLLRRNFFPPVEAYHHVVGSRRVVLNPSKDADGGFYGSNAFRFEVAQKILPHISEGMTAYYEIVGFVGDMPIMPRHSLEKFKDKKYLKKYGKEITYAYGCPQGTHDFYIYRLTYTTHSGQVLDMTQPQLVKWCENHGFKPSLDVVEPFIFDGDFEKLKALVHELTERPDVLTEDYRDPTIISEGVVVRIDNEQPTPTFLKSKSFVFKVCEGIAQEKEGDPEDES